MSTTSSPPNSPRRAAPRAIPARLPLLFGEATQLFGWQGLTATVPETWNLGHFGGTARQGQIRIDDEDGPRLEIRWETPPGEVNLGSSIDKFLQSLEKAAKKRGAAFAIAAPPKLVSKARKRKAQLVQFGWQGEQTEPTAHGWGVAWHCTDCGRVVVGHMMGRGGENGAEKQEKIQRLASEVFASLECHGSGGWQTWSVFGCRVEIPEEFELARASLMAGRLEWEWKRPKKPGLSSFSMRDERLTLARWSLAAVLLQTRTLEEWAESNVAHSDKKMTWKNWQSADDFSNKDLAARAETVLQACGVVRDLRLRLREIAFDFLLRRRKRQSEMLVWHDARDNKIFALSADVQPANAHVRDDVLDSLDCT
jgi:hypothetical protein